MENRVVFRDCRYCLFISDGCPYITAGDKTYALSCHPYEPCTFVKDGERLLSVIHNAFDPLSVFEAFASERTVTSVTGKVYRPEDFCKMIGYAADNRIDTDVGYVEGALAVEKLKELGAVSPESAVTPEKLGVRTISDRFSRSKKLKERVMYTEDGKVYVRIKG